jgi:hypothetical protein
MTLEEFEAALDLHGPSIADWPEPLRLAAAPVLAGSVEAQTMLAAAREVATLLAGTRAGPTIGVDRIVALATAQPQQRPSAPALWLPRAGWRYAACVAVTLTGFALGVADGLRHAPIDPIINLAFGPTDPFDAF